MMPRELVAPIEGKRVDGVSILFARHGLGAIDAFAPRESLLTRKRRGMCRQYLLRLGKYLVVNNQI
jgi:hypothetical protein